jgi:hypothetical protein
MSEGGVGRLLSASLHQGIADLLPARLEFYESWLNPAGLRDGRIGRAPLMAVLSFLRQEGDAYRIVTAQAGEYTAEWTVADLSGAHRSLLRAAPERMRVRLALSVGRRMIRSTFVGTEAAARMRRGGAVVTLRGSVFCSVRERAGAPLCTFYASALGKLMELLDLDVETGVETCRATGGDGCSISVRMRRARINGLEHD